MRSDEEAPEYGDALGREWHEAADHILICEGRFRGEAEHVASVGSAAVDNPQPTKAPSNSRSAVGLPQCYLPLQSTGEIAGETARVHHAARRRCCVAARGEGATGEGCSYRLPRSGVLVQSRKSRCGVSRRTSRSRL